MGWVSRVRVGVSLWVLFWVFVGLCFLFVFLFIGVPFIYSSCTKGCLTPFLIKFDITYPKRKLSKVRLP
jgi:hypothetical protein